MSQVQAKRAELLGPRFALHRSRLAWAVVTLAMAYFCYRFIPLMVTHHRNFGTQHFDLGIFDQATYLLANGDQFMTARGLNVFGHHANFGLYFFAPLYWFGLGGPILLNIATVISLAAAAIPIHLIAKERTGSAGVGVVISLAYLAHFSISAMVNEGFHPEKMAVPALFAAFYFANRRWWVLYAISLVYAASWKEDVALFVVMLGIYVFFAASRRVGLITTVTAAIYFLMITSVFIPAFNDAGTTFYGSHYGELGESGIDVATNAVLFKRDVTFARLGNNNATGYFFDLGQPYGWLSYLSPHWMLLALPQLGANLLNVHGLSANPFAHYVSVPIVALTLGLIAVFAARKQWWLRTALGIWVLVFAFNTEISRGFTTHSENYETGVWQLYHNERTDRLKGAVDLVPDDAVVAASYSITPHLTRRTGVYRFPNPFLSEYWGIGNPPIDDPLPVEYILLDSTTMGEESIRLAEQLAAGDFETIYVVDTVTVLRRTG